MGDETEKSGEEWAQILAHPAVVAVFAVFPDAVIVDVRPLVSAAPR